MNLRHEAEALLRLWSRAAESSISKQIVDKVWRLITRRCVVGVR